MGVTDDDVEEELVRELVLSVPKMNDKFFQNIRSFIEHRAVSFSQVNTNNFINLRMSLIPLRKSMTY